MDGVLDVVVVTYNSAHVVSGLLDSLPAALEGMPAKTVVVDNGSSDNTLEVLTSRADCSVVSSANLGYAAGINRGVHELRGTGPILVLNPDVRLAPGSIAPLLQAMRLPRTGIVAPMVLDDRGALSLSLRREPTLARAIGIRVRGNPRFNEYVEDVSAYEQPQVPDWALGAALLISRECYNALGGWDESFFLYSEETDFCLRGRDLGYLTRYEPSSVVTHIGGQSGQTPSIHAMQIVNRVRLYRRRHHAASSMLYLLLAVASELSWLARGHRQSLAAVRALLLPKQRPRELGCSDRLLPT